MQLAPEPQQAETVHILLSKLVENHGGALRGVFADTLPHRIVKTAAFAVEAAWVAVRGVADGGGSGGEDERD